MKLTCVVSFLFTPSEAEGLALSSSKGLGKVMMQVTINGKAAELPDNCSIKDLLASKKISEDVVILELNGEIINRGKWDGLKLKSDDSLELIRIISGG